MLKLEGKHSATKKYLPRMNVSERVNYQVCLFSHMRFTQSVHGLASLSWFQELFSKGGMLIKVFCNCLSINTLSPKQNGCHFADNSFKCIYLIERVCILIHITLFVPEGRIHNKSALVQVMAWRQTGAKPLPEPMMIQFTGECFHH